MFKTIKICLYLSATICFCLVITTAGSQPITNDHLFTCGDIVLDKSDRPYLFSLDKVKRIGEVYAYKQERWEKITPENGITEEGYPLFPTILIDYKDRPLICYRVTNPGIGQSFLIIKRFENGFWETLGTVKFGSPTNYTPSSWMGQNAYAINIDQKGNIIVIYQDFELFQPQSQQDIPPVLMSIYTEETNELRYVGPINQVKNGMNSAQIQKNSEGNIFLLIDGFKNTKERSITLYKSNIQVDSWKEVTSISVPFGPLIYPILDTNGTITTVSQDTRYHPINKFKRYENNAWIEYPSLDSIGFVVYKFYTDRYSKPCVHFFYIDDRNARGQQILRYEGGVWKQIARFKGDSRKVVINKKNEIIFPMVELEYTSIQALEKLKFYKLTNGQLIEVWR